MVALAGALIAATGLGVVIHTNWFTTEKPAKTSWVTVAVGLIILVVGAGLSIIRDVNLGHSTSGGVTVNDTGVSVGGH